MFLDIAADNGNVQVMLNRRQVFKDECEEGKAEFRNFAKTVRRGDWIGKTRSIGAACLRTLTDEAAKGYRHRSDAEELTLLAIQMPEVLSVALRDIPLSLDDPEFRMRNRHVEMLVHPEVRETFALRSRLVNAIRTFFLNREFVEVNTPILAAGTGGAVARPFETIATELPELQLSLRVAPELYLKRLIAGGFERVFEIGPAFRNEGMRHCKQERAIEQCLLLALLGVDNTHNPEFTTCEFYEIMTSLPELMSTTETLFRVLANVSNGLSNAAEVDLGFEKPFAVIEFIPALEYAMKKHIEDWTLPDLTKNNAADLLLKAYEQLPFAAPRTTSVPKILDALASELLESSCQQPTFIIHHPECMSPLAKSFDRAYLESTHRVSARAELFIRGREYVNCYEEENSPLEQRRKFEAQLSHQDKRDQHETHGEVDDSYLGALEWGMPPTGGWGCGIDRIVMLFGGKARIADVLPFGTLRNVAALGSAQARRRVQPVLKDTSSTHDGAGSTVATVDRRTGHA